MWQTKFEVQRVGKAGQTASCHMQTTDTRLQYDMVIPFLMQLILFQKQKSLKTFSIHVSQITL